MRPPGPNQLAHNARDIIAALRAAGANEPRLGQKDLQHLDLIQAGRYCCLYHRSLVWFSFGFDSYPFVGLAVIFLLFSLMLGACNFIGFLVIVWYFAPSLY